MRNYPPIPEAPDVSALSDLVRVDGFGLLRGGGPAALAETLRSLGDVLFVEEVKTANGSRALVTSTRALSPHTDHHRARWIVWICLQPAELGGDSLVIDGLAALARLTDEQRDALTRVELFEHSVFAGDMERHAMLTRTPGARPRLYYSYWLAEEAMPPAEQAAFDAFTDAVRASEQHRSRLRPGDLLVVDNHRVLHGRTAIEAGSRHLTRYWLGETSSGRG